MYKIIIMKKTTCFAILMLGTTRYCLVSLKVLKRKYINCFR